jgi:hypothetical protein
MVEPFENRWPRICRAAEAKLNDSIRKNLLWKVTSNFLLPNQIGPIGVNFRQFPSLPTYLWYQCIYIGQKTHIGIDTSMGVFEMEG